MFQWNFSNRWFHHRRSPSNFKNFSEHSQETFPVEWVFSIVTSGFSSVDTGRKLNVHKMFRRCPWRLLNVLCTFSLRPLSTGSPDFYVIFPCKLILQHNPVNTGRKLNVYKTFRRRPWRLPNVLCTFNLRPVSTGEERCYKK